MRLRFMRWSQHSPTEYPSTSMMKQWGVSGDPAINCLQLTQRTRLKVFVVSILHHRRVIVPLEQKAPVVFSHGSQLHLVPTQIHVVGLQSSDIVIALKLKLRDYFVHRMSRP